MRPGNRPPPAWLRPAAAAALWGIAVVSHAQAQEAFALAARTWGFDAVQRWQGWAWAVVAPLGVGWALARAGRRGRRAVAAVVGTTLLDLAAATTFVTRAEALHYPIYAAIAWVAGPSVRGFWVVCAAGVFDELLQWAWLDPARAGPGPDVKDMLLNGLGAATGLAWGWATGTEGLGARGLGPGPPPAPPAGGRGDGGA